VDGFSITLSYSVGGEQLYVNGVLLERGVDYTATNGTSITISTALVVGDLVTVISQNTFAIANAIPLSTVTAKGDLIAATGASTVTNLPVGADGTTLVANSASATGMAWAGPTFAAGKNKIINGDFSVWQRGTSFSNPAILAYTADRWAIYYDGSGATRTISQQTFTPGTAPVAGYEGQYFFRYAQTVAGTSNTVNLFYQKIENVQSFAGQSIVLSFWAKADTARSITCTVNQSFGSGGSADVDTNFTNSASLTTSWQRFSLTVAVPSISGKTVGASSYLGIRLFFPAGTTPTIDLWGIQVEAGSVATPFTTATGTLQGELAACQRYYEKSYSQGTALGTATEINTVISSSNAAAATNGYIVCGLQMKVIKRAVPTITFYDTAGTIGKGSRYTVGTSTSTGNSIYLANMGDSLGLVYSTGVTATGIEFHYTADAEL
jgi:hypothetical protein